MEMFIIGWLVGFYFGLGLTMVMLKNFIKGFSGLTAYKDKGEFIKELILWPLIIIKNE